MLQNYYVPKKLRTIHFPGQQIELWLNEIKLCKLDDVSPNERTFIKDFIHNLENLGWKVRVKL
jgi:hypothetical protein